MKLYTVFFLVLLSGCTSVTYVSNGEHNKECVDSVDISKLGITAISQCGESKSTVKINEGK